MHVVSSYRVASALDFLQDVDKEQRSHTVMEDNGAGPNSLQLLDDQRVRQETLSLCSNGYLQCRYSSHSSLQSCCLRLSRAGPIGSWSTTVTWETLQRKEVIGKCIYIAETC